MVYKEQLRQNQAATNTLMARLEAQIAICSSAEKQLAEKFKQRDELEKHLRPEWEQARKRSRFEDDDVFAEEKQDRTLIYLPRIKSRATPLHKELRKFLEEEHKLSEDALSFIEEEKMGEEEIEELPRLTLGPEMEEGTTHNEENLSLKFSFAEETEVEEDEELRKERGKGNVEKWLHMLLEDTGAQEPETSNKSNNAGAQEPETSNKTDEIIKKLNEKYPQKEIKVLKFPVSDEQNMNEEIIEVETKKARSMSTPRRSISSEARNKEKKNAEISTTEDKKPRSMSTPRRSISSETDVNGKGSEPKRSFGGGKEKGIARTESARFFRPIPSSPSKILNMRKGVDCIRKKPLVIDDDEDDYYGDGNHQAGNNFLKSSIKSIKKAVRS